MMSNGLTVIVPFYNTQKQTLLQCIKSIINNSRNDFELIIVNDGSEDIKLEKAIKSINDKRIIYKKKRNGGVSSARNLGINNSTKQYITFVDSDDEVKPNFIDTIINELKAEPDFLLFNCSYSRAGNINTYKFPNDINIDNIMSLLLCNRVPSAPWGKVYKRSIIKEENIRFDEEIRIGEDLLFLFEYIKRIHTMRAINEQLYLYKINDSGAMSNIDNRHDVLEVLHKLITNKKNMKYITDLKTRYYYEYRNIPKNKKNGYKSIGLFEFLFNKNIRITTKIKTLMRFSR